MYLDKMKEMYNLQHKLNNETTKIPDWFKGYSGNGMKVNWFRYIKMESSELIESFPIKHWKDVDKKINFLNSKVELVDIWHFLLSKIIETDLLKNFDKEKTISNISNVFQFSYITYKGTEIKESNHTKYCELFENYLNEFDYCIAENSLKNCLENYSLDKFIKLCCSVGLSFEELHKLYIGKNCLNQFRQDNGYKENTYKKIWDGKEDNEVMFEIVSNLQDINYSILYKELERKYQTLK